jgi:DMSO/TMAO reductase YedYZ molybdopterin-dependent catalytic subunit
MKAVRSGDELKGITTVFGHRFETTGLFGLGTKRDGLVEQPFALSLSELRTMPSRTQITRHDCVEGWGCIGKWKGVQLSALLERARLKPNAHFIVFYCADALGDTGTEADKYYGSIGLADAFHAQTILAYEMNDRSLPIPHGAPLRLRVERQFGYEMAKYVMRIEAVENFTDIRGGRGGSGKISATSGTRESDQANEGPRAERGTPVVLGQLTRIRG